jgi:hypothetical protein
VTKRVFSGHSKLFRFAVSVAPFERVEGEYQKGSLLVIFYPIISMIKLKLYFYDYEFAT